MNEPPLKFSCPLVWAPPCGTLRGGLANMGPGLDVLFVCSTAEKRCKQTVLITLSQTQRKNRGLHIQTLGPSGTFSSWPNFGEKHTAFNRGFPKQHPKAGSKLLLHGKCESAWRVLLPLWQTSTSPGCEQLTTRWCCLMDAFWGSEALRMLLQARAPASRSNKRQDLL